MTATTTAAETMASANPQIATVHRIRHARNMDGRNRATMATMTIRIIVMMMHASRMPSGVAHADHVCGASMPKVRQMSALIIVMMMHASRMPSGVAHADHVCGASMPKVRQMSALRLRIFGVPFTVAAGTMMSPNSWRHMPSAPYRTAR